MSRYSLVEWIHQYSDCDLLQVRELVEALSKEQQKFLLEALENVYQDGHDDLMRGRKYE